MKFFRSLKNVFVNDAAIPAAGLGTLFKVLGIVVIGGMAVIIAVGIALGVGLGVGLQKSPTTISTIPPPTVSCNTLVTTCGCPAVNSTLSTRIIGGSTAAAASWPWMVYIVAGGVRVCSGFLVSTHHVITAASCVTRYGYNVSVNIGTSYYSAYFDGNNITNSSAPTTNASSIISNSTFQPLILQDIAVLTLFYNVTYGLTVKPCCVSSTRSDPVLGTIGVLAGFGETSTNTLGTPATLLQQAVLQVRSPTDCAVQASDVFCAGSNSASACPIDVGGPFMISENNVWTCVGVMTGETNCVSPIPFTRISDYYSFLQNVTNYTQLNN